MRRPVTRDALRRIWAGCLGIAVLWVVFSTAGAETLSGALETLDQGGNFPLTLLRLQLGEPGEDNWLTTATALAIGQSPLLSGSRDEILELRSQTEGDSDQEEPEQQPVQETPATPQQPEQPQELTFADNGVTPRTLVPTTTSGYVVSGLAYVNNTSNCSLTAEQLAQPYDAKLTAEGPQILIVHTHGSESYTMPPGQEYEATGECRTTDTNYNVVRVGDEMAEVFGQYGISVIHDRNMYDYPQYNGAYDRSLAAIESYLEQYPTISIVLDIHRDAIYDSAGNPYKVISQEAEGNAAQMTLVLGSNGGSLPHENWLENVKLAAAVQNTLLAEHPTLMRPMVVRNSRYNQHCTTGSLLVEVGAAGNSLDEALLAGRLFAQGLVKTLQG